MAKPKIKAVVLSMVLFITAANAQITQDTSFVSADTTPKDAFKQCDKIQFDVTDAENDEDELSVEEKKVWIQKFQLMKDKGHRLRRNGMIMIGGGICWLLGWSTILALKGADPNDQTTYDLVVLPIALGTTGFVGGGTAMLVKGKKLVQRGEQKQKELTISLLPGINKISLMVEY